MQISMIKRDCRIMLQNNLLPQSRFRCWRCSSKLFFHFHPSYFGKPPMDRSHPLADSLARGRIFPPADSHARRRLTPRRASWWSSQVPAGGILRSLQPRASGPPALGTGNLSRQWAGEPESSLAPPPLLELAASRDRYWNLCSAAAGACFLLRK
jgi:hypothetical protein